MWQWHHYQPINRTVSQNATMNHPSGDIVLVSRVEE